VRIQVHGSCEGSLVGCWLPLSCSATTNEATVKQQGDDETFFGDARACRPRKLGHVGSAHKPTEHVLAKKACLATGMVGMCWVLTKLGHLCALCNVQCPLLTQQGIGIGRYVRALASHSAYVSGSWVRRSPQLQGQPWRHVG
jgi:hypothetical protein